MQGEIKGLNKRGRNDVGNKSALNGGQSKLTDRMSMDINPTERLQVALRVPLDFEYA